MTGVSICVGSGFTAGVATSAAAGAVEAEGAATAAVGRLTPALLTGVKAKLLAAACDWPAPAGGADGGSRLALA